MALVKFSLLAPGPKQAEQTTEQSKPGNMGCSTQLLWRTSLLQREHKASVTGFRVTYRPFFATCIDRARRSTTIRRVDNFYVETRSAPWLDRQRFEKVFLPA